MAQPCPKQNHRTGGVGNLLFKNITHVKSFVFICIISLTCLLSCGLEAFYYIDYIPQGEYLDTSATINLPSSSTEGYNYFDNFIIFYRIYLSDVYMDTGNYLTSDSSGDLRSQISPALNSNYNSIYPSTDITSTSVITSNLENRFYSWGYFLLTLEGADIENVLGSRSLGGRLEIYFPPNDNPTLRLGETSYILQRAVSGRDTSGKFIEFNPEPTNRYFLNHSDLFDPAKAPPNATDINADVATNSRIDTPRYTYVSMYIAAKGKSSEMPPSDIYSQPTFIGIFRLASI